MATLNALQSKLEQMAKTRDRDLAKFQEKIATDPVHAFVWADSVMASVAAGQVADHYLASIKMWRGLSEAGTLEAAQPQDEAGVLDFIGKSIIRQALNKGRYPKQSSSMTSNRMDQFEAATYADLAADWEMMYE